MHRFRFPLIILTILFCLLVHSVNRCDASGTETLHLKTGEEITGQGHGIENGMLKWELPLGTILTVPLDEIDYIEYPAAAEEQESGPALAPLPDEDADPEENTDGDEKEKEEGEEEGEEEKEEYQPSLPEKIINNPVETPEIVYESIYGGLEQTYVTVNNWTRRIEFGARYLDGNSQEESFTALMRLEEKTDDLFQQHNLGGQYGKSSHVLIANQWYLKSTFDFNRTDKWVIFVSTKNETDELQKLRYRVSASSGLGYQFFMEPKKRLVTRLGPGVTHENFRNPEMKRTTPDLFGEWEFHWPIKDRVQFEHKTTLTPSLSDISVFRSLSNYGILFQLDEESEWSFKMGVKHEYNSKPNDGRKPSDLTTTVQLVYSRK